MHISDQFEVFAGRYYHRRWHFGFGTIILFAALIGVVYGSKIWGIKYNLVFPFIPLFNLGMVWLWGFTLICTWFKPQKERIIETRKSFQAIKAIKAMFLYFWFFVGTIGSMWFFCRSILNLGV